MQCADKKRIIEYIQRNMTEKRRNHTYAVAEEAKKLARRYGEDMDKAELAALFHDFFRGVPESVLNGYVKQLGLPSRYLNHAALAHGKIAAQVMERDYGVTDQDIINAVSFHTTGRAGMSTLEKIVYLADAIEPGRAYPGVEEIRALAYQNLDDACRLSLERSMDYVNAGGSDLDQDTVRARSSLMDEKNKAEKNESISSKIKTNKENGAASAAERGK